MGAGAVGSFSLVVTAGGVSTSGRLHKHSSPLAPPMHPGAGAVVPHQHQQLYHHAAHMGGAMPASHGGHQGGGGRQHPTPAAGAGAGAHPRTRSGILTMVEVAQDQGEA
jgi:hypothetical protein